MSLVLATLKKMQSQETPNLLYTAKNEGCRNSVSHPDNLKIDGCTILQNIIYHLTAECLKKYDSLHLVLCNMNRLSRLKIGTAQGVGLGGGTLGPTPSLFRGLNHCFLLLK